jgi:hypothetical protein
MHEWISFHETFLWCIGSLSVLTIFVTIIAIPVMAVRIPEDYFMHHHRHRRGWHPQHPVLRFLYLLFKNFSGVIFILAGLGMLVFPGQGLITMVIGLMLLDFPGKYAIERWVIELPVILYAINRIRIKAHHPPLRDPSHHLFEKSKID